MKLFYRILTLAICLTDCCNLGFGSEEHIPPWQTFSVTAELDQPFGKVLVSAESRDTNFNRTLKNLKITSNGRVLTVPKAAILRMKNPDLSSLRISSEAGYDRHPWLYISFTLSMPERGMTNWNYPRSYLAFQNGRYVKSYKTASKPGGGRDFFDEWKP